jgi:photosystem II stability/assembly factor-like uncharacterized protein/peptidoglycan/xylan/chitin deacetylase (PgdA/CDA1 family)
LSRSDDGGKTWQMLHGHLPGLSGNNSVRGVLVDPRDDNKIIVATGDRWAKRGIYVSDDAGATFTQTLTAQYYGNGAMRPAGFILARHPQDPNVVVTAAVDDGVFISRDNGKTWSPSADNVKGLYPSDIRFDRKNGNRLWMCAGSTKLDKTQYAPGFFRSDDGGATWEKLSDVTPQEIVQDPKEESTLFGIFKSEIIRKSTDGGTTWEDFSDGLQIKRLEPGKWKESIDKTAYNALGVGPDFVLTCNTRDADIYKLQSGATKWEKIERNAPEVGDWYHKGGWAFGGAAGSLTVDPHDANHWFLTDFFAIYQTFDGGKNWRLTVDGLETTVAHCTLQDPTDPGVMHVGLADVGNFNSFDGGTRFRKASVPNDKTMKDADAGGGNMKCMDLNPKMPNRLYGVANRNWYVLWEANQVYISDDRGQTWKRSPMTGLPAKVICSTIIADANDPNTVYLTVAGPINETGGGGVYKSTDGGVNWTWMSQGMPTTQWANWYFPDQIWAHGRQLASSADGSLVAISKQQNLVYRFDPNTNQWTRINFQRGGQLWSVAADRLKLGRYFIGARNDGAYRSDDGGLTWKKVYNGSISFIETDAAVAGRVAGSTLDGIVLSTDGGDTWKMMDKGLPARVDAIPGFAGERLFAATGGSGVFWMPLSPAGEKTVAAKPLDAKQVVAPTPVNSATAATPAANPTKAAAAPTSTQTSTQTATQQTPLTAGSTRVAKWQDDKKAVFLLMFDDGWPSHWQVALPELKKRNMIGTFYVVPSKGEYTKFEKTWLTDMLAAGMVFGNHTMTHDGFQGKEDTEKEINSCNEYLLKNVPGKTPRLISFALPGVKDYDYGGLDFKALLAQNNLIDRPDFRGHGANYHIKTLEEYLALADKAIAAGDMEYIVYHGLERVTPNWGYQDMWAVKQDVFLPFLDGLQQRRDRGDLWITDHISWHQYKTERESAKVAVSENTSKRIALKLTTSADPKFYDLPLTLVTQVPASWKKCQITQGAKTQTVDVAQSSVRFQAQPDGSLITLVPA